MPLTHTIDDEARLVVVSGNGEPALAAASGSIGALMQLSGRAHSYGLLILVHESAQSPAVNELPVLADLLRTAGSLLNGPVAIVTHGIGQAIPAELLALLGGVHRPIQAFLDEVDARRWLASQATA